jgi:hypothetical protein
MKLYSGVAMRNSMPHCSNAARVSLSGWLHASWKASDAMHKYTIPQRRSYSSLTISQNALVLIIIDYTMVFEVVQQKNQMNNATNAIRANHIFRCSGCIIMHAAKEMMIISLRLI